MISRRGILAGLLAGAALPGYAEVMPSSPRPKLRGDRAEATNLAADPARQKTAAQLVAAAELGGTVGYLVIDAKTGAVLEEGQADTPMPPASVTKAVTALYALDQMGAGQRFTTRVLATGPVRDGKLQGDLVLLGGGDPTLQTDQLGDLAYKLRQRGVTGITGRYLYCEVALPRLTQVATDQPVQVGYNPALSGLNLNFNRVYFEWKQAGKGYQLSMDARGERFVPPVAMVSMQVAQRETPIFTYQGAAAHEDLTVAATALGKGGSRWLPVRLPGLYAAEVFQTLAKAQGIALPAPQSVSEMPKADELARVQSDPLPEVLRAMLRFSTNLTAECAGLSASRMPALGASATAMNQWVRNTFGTAVDFADHSGLGGASRISARAMVKILAQAQQEGRGLRPILRDHGMKDDQGKLIKNHPVKVAAKTGTLNFVSSLAGHIRQPNGRELIFAIFSGDPARRDAIPVAGRENPPGMEAWVRRARRLQGQLINRWSALYA